VARKEGNAKPVPGVIPVTWWASYVGTPFRDGGRGQDGLDCWGLVVACYRDILGVELPGYGEISARDLARVARAMSTGKDDGWRPVDDPVAMDVALMRAGNGGRLVVHVGVMVDRDRVLHTEAGTAVVVVPVKHFSIAGRIAGYRRLAA
jgi:cell wall-associated NlpC family hydrolase